MTPPQFARLHGVTVKVVYKWIRQGRVRFKSSPDPCGRNRYWITQRERPEKRGQG